MEDETICAISTCLGNSAISIIRMSGGNALKIAEKFFTAKNLNYKNIKPRYMYLGTFKNDTLLEKCLMVYFEAPNSYTGEDLVEFQIHGGEFLVKKILEILSQECQLATPGEFSKRAFFNNKITLEQAESIVDVINAESDAELSSAYVLASGKFNIKIKEYQKMLTDMLARVEVALDYPEHNDELITSMEIKKDLLQMQIEIQQLLKNSETGEKIKSGVNVTIVGSPNVGKSSILNALLGSNRAIVTSIAGTTRDVLKETILYNGIKFNLVDTAGIRESDDIDEVEQIGIARAKKEIENSDIILAIIDLSRNLTDEEKDFFNKLDTKKTIFIGNKLDIKKSVTNEIACDLEISALEEKNIEKVKNILYEKVFKDKIDFSKIVLTNARHINCLKESLVCVNVALDLIEKETLDIIAFELKKIWCELGKITGETENEEIIDQIFSKFCLGK